MTKQEEPTIGPHKQEQHRCATHPNLQQCAITVIYGPDPRVGPGGMSHGSDQAQCLNLLKPGTESTMGYSE